MLTPQFKLTQSETHLILVLRLPYIKVSACEFNIDEHCFKFYLKPYLLSLTFQQSLEEAEEPAKATYYHDKHLLEVHIKKKVQGEHFQNLGLLGSLMGKKKGQGKGKGKGKLIQVVGETEGIRNQDETSGEGEGYKVNPYSYGFCHNYTKVFTNLEQQRIQLFAFSPEEVSIPDRLEFSKKITESCFDSQAYLYDKHENDELPSLLKSSAMQESIEQLLKQFNSKQPQNYQKFKANLKLSNKEILVSKEEEKHIGKQLLAISFCYLYELCCMSGQMSVQSAKTINQTCAVFHCCLDYSQQSLNEVLQDCTLRCLTYSLYKSLQLSKKVTAFLTKALTQQLLCAVLADLRAMFSKSEPRYLLNTVYLDDSLVYCLRAKLGDRLEELRKGLGEVEINEEVLGLEFQEEEDEEEEEEEEEEKGQEKPKQTPKIIQLNPEPSPLSEPSTEPKNP